MTSRAGGFTAIAAAVLAWAVAGQGLAESGDSVARDPVSTIVWADASRGFGGFSGLALLPQSDRFLAVTDRAILVTGALKRDAEGRLAGVAIQDAVRLSDRTGAPATGFDADAETLRIAPDGSVLIGFEGKTRVERFHPPDWRRQALRPWDALRGHWGNHGIEAMVILPDGAILAVLEAPGKDGAHATLVLRGDDPWTPGQPLLSDGTFMAVDAVLGGDGALYLLERAHSLFWGYRSRISRHAPVREDFGRPEVLMQTAWSVGGNFEGFDLRVDGRGRLIALAVTDNNFNPFAPTTLAEFDLGVSPWQPPVP